MDRLERRAGALLGLMAGAALACVAAGVVVVWSASDDALSVRLFSLATGVVVLAPLVSLIGVTLGAMKSQRRLAMLAFATLLVTLVGMGLAR